MDNQTWSGALRQVGATLWKWPIIIGAIACLIINRLPEPSNGYVAAFVVILSLGMSAWLVVDIARTLRRVRAAHLRHREMLAAEKELQRCFVELQRLIQAQGELYIAGKLDEVRAMQPQVNAIIEEQGRWMLKSIGIDLPHTHE